MIGSGNVLATLKVILKFQFHYGMIGSRWRKPYRLLRPLFQFHYGMIGRLCWLTLRHIFAKFQFHYGMIGRCDIRCMPFNLLRFNSTMGWLEVFAPNFLALANRVSIPLWDDWKIAPNADFGELSQFQFHYGMIGSARANGSLQNQCGFNSTMGWLEAEEELQGWSENLAVSIPLWDDWKCRIRRLLPMPTCFNSTMGWLEEYNLNLVVGILVGFNSTMGWLEGSRSSQKSRWRCFNSTMGWLEERHPSLCQRSPMFQFHYGMIGSEQRLYLPKRNVCVSIPLWDDWKKIIACIACITSMFQFHYGMIGRRASSLALSARSCFNSTMGWLEVGQICP